MKASLRVCHKLRLIVTQIGLLGTPEASDSSGSVVTVLDGDTKEVLYNEHSERTRISGIDCPEKGQASASELRLS